MRRYDAILGVRRITFEPCLGENYLSEANALILRRFDVTFFLVYGVSIPSTVRTIALTLNVPLSTTIVGFERRSTKYKDHERL